MKLAVRGQGLLIAIGVLLVGVGVVSIVRPFLVISERSAADNAALKAWQDGGALNLQGAVVPGFDKPNTTTVGCTAGASSADAYALVTFPSLPAFGYAGVAVDTNWDGLLSRSMVHWKGSAAPGAQGNVIIAFHREPDYEHIDELSAGQIVNVEDRNCHVYSYKITSRQELAPDKVTQLVPTAGYNLTLITCTPFWEDYDRLVWQSTLVAVNGSPYTG